MSYSMHAKAPTAEINGRGTVTVRRSIFPSEIGRRRGVPNG